MATNYIQPGGHVTVTAPDGSTDIDVVSGAGVRIGNLFGVALTDAAMGATVVIATEGVFEMAKTSALAIAVGDLVYWDDTNKVVNKTASSQLQVGIAVTAAANPSSTVHVKLTPSLVIA